MNANQASDKQNTVLLKYAIGDTNLICKPQSYTWSAKCDIVSDEFKLYERLKSYVFAAKDLMKKYGWDLQVKVFIFIQGEGDARDTTMTNTKKKEEY